MIPELMPASKTPQPIHNNAMPDSLGAYRITAEAYGQACAVPTQDIQAAIPNVEPHKTYTW